MALTKFEELCELAYAQLIEIFEHALPERVRGFYYEDEFNKIISLNSDIKDIAEKICVLTEEIGHSIYGGNQMGRHIPELMKRKYEFLARKWAYKKLLPIRKLIAALKSPYFHNYYEIAEEFDVTQDFLGAAIEYYKSTGDIPRYNNYNERCFCG